MKLLIQALISSFALASFSGAAAQISPPLAITAPPAALIGESAAGPSSLPVFSADGKYLAFVSRAPNLVTNPTGGRFQIFLRDLASGDLTLLSVTATGAGGNDHSTLPSLSSNGLWVAFESEASDLVSGDTNEVSDVFVRDVAGGQTILVSGGNGASRSPMISADGRYVAFESRASDLSLDDTNRAADVFIRDLLLGTTTLVSVNVAGTGTANRGSELLTITPDGRFVAFWSDATDISVESSNALGQVYVRDVQNGLTYCLTENLAANPRRFKTVLTPDGRFAGLQELSYSSVASAGHVFWADVFGGSTINVYPCGWPGPGLAISEDGTKLIHSGCRGLYLWETSARTNRLLIRDSDLGTFEMLSSSIGSFHVTPDFQQLFYTIVVSNRGPQLFKYDLTSAETFLLSTNESGTLINAGVVSPFSISDSGSVIAFETAADDLGPKDLNRAPDIYVTGLGLISGRDPANPEATGLGYGTLHRNAISADGNRLAFISTDSSLTLNDTNRRHDVFVRDLRSNAPVNIGGLLVSNTAGATALSADGRSLAYERFSGEELVQTAGDLWRADLRTGETYPVVPFGSRGPWFSWQPSFSQDGRWLVVRDPDHILVTDFRTPMVPGQASNQVVDIRYDGTRPGNGPSSSPAISLDGEWVVFLSRATDLQASGQGGTGGGTSPALVPQVFARNLRTQQLRLVSFADNFAPLAAGATNASISANARFVLFESLTGSNIYRHDLSARGRVTNELVCTGCAQPSMSGDGSLISYNVQGLIYLRDFRRDLVGPIPMAAASHGTVSTDGRFVAFVSGETGISQVYVYDHWNLAIHLISRNYLGTGGGNGPSSMPVLSHDGRTIAFQSFASDLVPGDYNGRRDIFVAQVAPVDTDGDGMDDDWEMHYFSTLDRDGAGNLDGDHETDREEYLAGTDPTDAMSSLRFTGISRTTRGAYFDTSLSWLSAPGKTYRLQHKAFLTAPWSDLTGEIMTGGLRGTASHLEHHDDLPLHRFYRVRLIE